MGNDSELEGLGEESRAFMDLTSDPAKSLMGKRKRKKASVKPPKQRPVYQPNPGEGQNTFSPTSFNKQLS